MDSDQIPEGLHAYVDGDGHTIVADAQDIIWVEIWPGGRGDSATWRDNIERLVLDALGVGDPGRLSDSDVQELTDAAMRQHKSAS